MSAVLLGSAISGERTLEAFYERLLPLAIPFMVLFGRDRLPARSTLSRFLAALTPEPVEALHTLFLEDLLARPLVKEEQSGELWDREGIHSLPTSYGIPPLVELPPNGIVAFKGIAS